MLSEPSALQMDTQTVPGSVVAGWRPTWLSAMAAFHNYSAAACEAMVVISQCNEVLLKCALACSDSASLHLSAMLRMNAALLRLALAGALFSREPLDQRRHSRCSTWPPSRAIVRGDAGCSPLCWGDATCAERVTFVQSVVAAVSTLYRGARSVCRAALALGRAVRSLLCGNVRPTICTCVAACGCVRPAVLALLTAAGLSTQLLDLPSV